MTYYFCMRFINKQNYLLYVYASVALLNEQTEAHSFIEQYLSVKL